MGILGNRSKAISALVLHFSQLLNFFSSKILATGNIFAMDYPRRTDRIGISSECFWAVKRRRFNVVLFMLRVGNVTGT